MLRIFPLVIEFRSFTSVPLLMMRTRTRSTERRPSGIENVAYMDGGEKNLLPLASNIDKIVFEHCAIASHCSWSIGSEHNASPKEEISPE